MANSQINFETFQAWSAAKTREEFQAIVHRGSLNRKEIAMQCGFAKSVLAQNPRIHRLLQELETRLRADGTLPPADLPSDDTLPDSSSELWSRHYKGMEINLTESEHQFQEGLPQQNPSDIQLESAQTRQQSATRNLEPLVRRLQSENASQRAEIQELRRQLSKLSAINEALALTGRLPR